MKALVLRQLKQPLELEERPDLEPPAGEVVIDLQAAALNRRDYWITQGLYPDIRLPVVLGSDGCGVVSRVGAEVDPAWLGKEVVINPGFDWGDVEAVQSDSFTILGMPRDGTFATQVSVPVGQVYARPPHLSSREAAALPLAGVTAYRAVCTQGALQASERMLVTGIGGGVASWSLSFGVACGADVWVTSSSPEKIQRAIDAGAKSGFDYRDDQWVAACRREAGSFDLIIDSAGGDGYHALVELAAPGGRIVNYGATRGPAERLDLFKVFWKQLRLQGTTMGSPKDFASMLDFVTRHQLRPIIDQVFPLVDANRALERMATFSQSGKLVLDTKS